MPLVRQSSVRQRRARADTTAARRGRPGQTSAAREAAEPPKVEPPKVEPPRENNEPDEPTPRYLTDPLISPENSGDLPTMSQALSAHLKPDTPASHPAGR